MQSALEKSIHDLRDLIIRSKLTAEERGDLQDALNELTESLDDQSIDSSDLASGIYDQVMDFQESHPLLTKTINQVADTLAQMGI